MPEKRLQETRRAVKIAATIMRAAGLCRYDIPEKCRRASVDGETCDKCIEGWLLKKAHRELKAERKER